VIGHISKEVWVAQAIADGSFLHLPQHQTNRDMKITIKKKYVGAIASFATLFLTYWFVQELLIWLSNKSLSVLILPTIFFAFFIYTVNYWLNMREKDGIIDEVSKEVSKGDPAIASQVKEHLWRKSYEEAYTLNLFRGIVKFTSTWSEQDEFEKIKSNKNIPDVIKQELY
jgi:hypothetical protein